MKKALIPIFLSFVLLSGGIGIAEAAALTPSQISAIIGLLRSFGADEGVVANVNATISGAGVSVQPSITPASGSSAITYCPKLTNNLYRGSSDSRTGGEVSMLQKFLRQLYPDLPVTGYFGVLTEAAVERFQSQYGISTVGIVGPETSKKIASLCDPIGYPIDPLPPVGAGYLEIEPSSASIAVGGSVSMQAMYQPPMPKCPEGFACPQVMPARFPVEAIWTSNNSGIAAVSWKQIACSSSVPPTNAGCFDLKTAVVSGVSAGTAEIRAVYNQFSSISTATAKVAVGKGSSVSYINVLSPNGGETWIKGTTQTIKWQGSLFILPCAVGATCPPPPPEWPYNIKLVPYYPPCTGGACPMYPIQAPYTIANGVYGSSYSWSVGKIADAYVASDIASDGAYTIQVCRTNSTICDSSDSYFKIVSDGMSANSFPVINAFPAIPVSINVGQSVSFSWGATDADGDNLSWSVSWGDEAGVGGVCQSPNPQNKQGWTYNTSHAWSNPGTYTVKATVNDCRGGSNEHTFNVTVGSATQPSITILYPTGGELFPTGSGFDVKWQPSNIPATNEVTIGLRNISTGQDYALKSTINDGTEPVAIPIIIPAGQYKLFVKSLVGVTSIHGWSNLFSIGVTPSVTVISPNGGEIWVMGESQTVKWSGSNGTRVNITLLNTDKTKEVYGLAMTVINDGNEVIKVPYDLPAGQYYLRVSCVENCSPEASFDDSNAPFSIVAATAASPTLNVSLDASTPASATLKPGQTSVKFAQIKATAGSSPVNNLNGIQIGSDSSNASAFLTNIKVFDGATQIGGSLSELYWGGGYYQNWIFLSGVSIPANTSKIFTVVADVKPTAPSGSVRLGIAGWNFNAPGANVVPFGTPLYGNPMTMVAATAQPSITVTYPNGGEVCQIGSICRISWKYGSYFSKSGSLSVELYKGSNFIVSGGTAADDIYRVTSYDFNLPTYLSPGSDYSIKVLESNNPSNYDKSDAPFSIVAATAQPSITVLSPNGGETLKAGSTYALSWKSSGFISEAGWAVHLDLAESLAGSGGSQTQYQIFGDLPLSGSVNWTVPATYLKPGASYKIIAIALKNNDGSTAVLDYSDAPFSIVAATTQSSITVTYPNGGEIWVMGESQTVKWSGSNGTRVNITLLNIDKTKEVYGLAMTVINDGNEVIKVPYDLPAGQYYLRVSCVENCSPEASFDDSNAPFSISSSLGAAGASSGDGSSFAALLFSLERQLEELERLLNSLLR